MIVTCPRCLTKFNLPDENLELNVAINLRCSRCQEEFLCPAPDDDGPVLDEADFSSTGVEAQTQVDDHDDSEENEPVFASFTDAAEGESDWASETDEEKTSGDDNIEAEAEFELDVDALGPDDDTEVADELEGGLLENENIQDSIPQVESEPLTEVKSVPATRQTSSLFLAFAALLVLGLAFLTGYGLWQHFSLDMEKHLQLVGVSNQRLTLPSERVVLILRGEVVNTSAKMVTELKLKGVLVDDAGQVVREVVSAGGVSFSEKELDLLDNRKLASFEKKSEDLQPDGGELPFMIVFYDCPENARKCYVEISSFTVQEVSSH